MKLKGIHHVAIICSNYSRSKDFYANILGLQIIQETFRKDRNSYKLDLKMDDGTQLELFSFPNSPQRPSYPEAQGLRHLAFKVSDIHLCILHLANHGVETESVRIDEVTGKRFTFFSDPDGLPLELYEI